MPDRPEITDDLAVDLVEAGRWLSDEHKARPKHQLRALVDSSVELFGRNRYALKREEIHGAERAFEALARSERTLFRVSGISFIGDRRVSFKHHWNAPFAGLCARSSIVSVLKHFDGSTVESTSGLRQIMIYEMGLGLDYVVGEYHLNGHVGWFKKFFLSWQSELSAVFDANK